MAYQFGEFTLDEQLFQLRKGESEVALRPQAFDALLMLVETNERVVSKEELIATVWKGNRVSENAVSQCVREIRRALGEEARETGFIRTVHGRGFRFAGEVKRPVMPFPTSWAPGSRERLPGPVFAAAVLPFESPGGDASLTELGRGLAEKLTRSLARLRTVPIIAASSTWNYRRDSRTLETVGAELGAAYVVEGRMQQAGEARRVHVHLSDTVQGTEVWSEEFDGDAAGTFAMEEHLAAAVCGAIHPELVRSVAERTSHLPSDGLEARLRLVRGLEHFYRRSPADNQLAIELFTKALDEDVASSSTPYYLGLAHYNNVFYQWHPDWDGNIERARWAAERCRQVAPGDASGHMLEGLLHLFSGDGIRARVSAELAVEANPSLPEARALLGRVLALRGEGDPAIPHIELAIRLSPRDPWPGDYISALSLAHFASHRYEEALRRAERAAHHAPQLISSHLLVAASSALAGDLDTASKAAERVLQLSRFSVTPLRNLLSSSPEELRDRIFRGLSLAGLKVD
jgi:DNA-binding winged helix-turn-helix (wHTH) protein/TolB-like protein/Flp pilus assembly protein TadD